MNQINQMSILFSDYYAMREVFKFLSEADILSMLYVCKDINKNINLYIKLEDDKRFEIIVSKDILNNSLLLEKYCTNNDVIKIRKMINMNIKLYWSYGLLGACRGGYMTTVQLSIEKGADDLTWGLMYACIGGNIDIVKLMIEKGASSWNGGLYYACEHGHINIVKFMIEKGATRCSWCKKSIEEHLSKK